MEPPLPPRGLGITPFGGYGSHRPSAMAVLLGSQGTPIGPPPGTHKRPPKRAPKRGHFDPFFDPFFGLFGVLRRAVFGVIWGSF